MSGAVRDVVVVPSTLALLPEHAGVVDPVADLRVACRAAVAWLLERNPCHVEVVHAPARADNVERGVTRPAGLAIGRHLLHTDSSVSSVQNAGGATADESVSGLLVVANGSARRTEKAPGHLDERSFGFDAEIGRALASGDPGVLRGLDETLAADLWCHDVTAWRQLGERVTRPVATTTVDYEDDPYGVQYWVVRWTCAS